MPAGEQGVQLGGSVEVQERLQRSCQSSISFGTTGSEGISDVRLAIGENLRKSQPPQLRVPVLN